MAEKIIAAGGIVENEKGEILFQFRRGFWDLPKGKLDDGESIEACAVREVEEETGLKNINLGDLVDTTTHFYTEKNKEIEKITYWYAMRVEGDQTLVPQLEEGIQELKWVSKQNLEPYLSNTFINIVEIVEKYLNRQNQD